MVSLTKWTISECRERWRLFSVVSLGLSALASTKPFHKRALEVFTSPSALTFICLLLAILLMTLTALVILSWRRQRFSLFLFGSKKWSKAANKVVRETNLLYPWAAPPYHNCSHQLAKDATNGSAASYVGIRSSGMCSRVGRNLQVSTGSSRLME